MVLIEGGMDIEVVVEEIFEKIIIFLVDLVIGFMFLYGCKLVGVLNLYGDFVK